MWKLKAIFVMLFLWILKQFIKQHLSPMDIDRLTFTLTWNGNIECTWQGRLTVFEVSAAWHMYQGHQVWVSTALKISTDSQLLHHPAHLRVRSFSNSKRLHRATWGTNIYLISVFTSTVWFWPGRRVWKTKFIYFNFVMDLCVSYGTQTSFFTSTVLCVFRCKVGIL